MSFILPRPSEACSTTIFMKTFSFLVLGSVLMASPALAKDTEKRGEIFCFPAKAVPKLVDEVAEVKEKYRNIVDVTIDPKFLIKDGGVWPDQFYLARDGEVVTAMPFSKEDGRVANFMSAVRAAPDTDICVDDPTRANRPADDEGLYFELGLSPLFHNRSGQHSMAELEEGTKDGKKFYKKMIPDVFAFMMPDTDYLAVKYTDTRTPLQVFALVAGQEVALSSEPHKDFHVISFEEMEDMEASGLIIRGGEYHLQPVPSPKTMRRFGWGQKEDS
jgi:hypothetical protein